jgi:hypothetical protein
MMASPLYLLITICGVAGLWFVWDLGIKKLFLDIVRERLFELRFDLFKLAESGEVSFQDDAYRAIETLICGLLRFAHRVTLGSFLLSVWYQSKSKEANDFVDYHQQIEFKVSKSSPDAQKALNKILSDIQTAVTVYMAFSSLAFITASAIYMMLKWLHILTNNTRNTISHVVESEAYRLEAYRPVARGGRSAVTA